MNEIGLLVVGLCIIAAAALAALVVTLVIVVRKAPMLDTQYLGQVATQGAHAFDAGFTVGVRAGKAEGMSTYYRTVALSNWTRQDSAPGDQAKPEEEPKAYVPVTGNGTD